MYFESLPSARRIMIIGTLHVKRTSAQLTTSVPTYSCLPNIRPCCRRNCFICTPCLVIPVQCWQWHAFIDVSSQKSILCSTSTTNLKANHTHDTQLTTANYPGLSAPAYVNWKANYLCLSHESLLANWAWQGVICLSNQITVWTRHRN